MSDDSTDGLAPTIDICCDGPLIVNVSSVIDGAETDAGAALCRCGQSGNKPFCDGSHNTAGFKDAGAVKASGDADEALANPVTIRLATNGPLLCTGPLSVRSADGATIHAVPKAALCRCGASTNKPFCDGTHGKVDFKSD